jgi:hypothetical protein
MFYSSVANSSFGFNEDIPAQDTAGILRCVESNALSRNVGKGLPLDAA